MRVHCLGFRHRFNALVNCGLALRDVVLDTFEKIDKSAATGIHHTGLGQHLQLFGGIGQRLLGGLEASAEQSRQIGQATGKALAQSDRTGRDHTQDRALAWFGQRQPR